MHFLWRSTIRLGLLLLFVACLILWGASAAANYFFGMQQCGEGLLLSYVCGGASIASDVMKAAVVFAAIWAWRTRHWLATVACLVVAVVTITYSLISAASFHSWLTADVRADRTLRSATTDNRVAEMQSLQDALAAARQASIKDKYRQDRATARETAKELQARIDWLRAELRVTPAISGADPTAQLVKQLGYDPSNIPILRLVFFVALLELGSAACLTAFSQLFAHGVPVKPPPRGGVGRARAPSNLTVLPSVPKDATRDQQNAAQAVAFVRQMIHDGYGNQDVAADVLQARYAHWCARTQQSRAMAHSVLGRHMIELGVQSRRSSRGRTYTIPDDIEGVRYLRVVAG